jgi:signal peptidase I
MSDRRHRRSRSKGLPPWLSLLGTTLAALGCGVLLMATRPYIVPSESMEPILEKGDRFRADVLIAPRQGPRRGEIWVLQNPQPDDGNGPILVKRVVGLPGDRVAVGDGKLILNGSAQEEPYVRDSARYETPTRRLQEGEYWVLGDNRNHSEDSHAWGPIGRSAFVGRAFVRYAPLSRFGWL